MEWRRNSINQTGTKYIIMNKLFAPLITTALLLAACTQPIPPQAPTTPNSSTEVIREVSLSTDFTNAKIDPEALEQGCFGGQDCIPSIDKPRFESAQSANEWLNKEDIVFALRYKDIQRAYPQRILNWHEIVNDTVAGDPILITFCPLCGSALAFERKVDGVITEFGVSGKLHNSDLVMYDRYEGSLWQQISGEGIVGPAAQRDEVLIQVPISTTTWGEWKEKFPETEVLTRHSGGYSNKRYAQYPYGTYEEDDALYFGVEDEPDESLQIKTVVYGLELNGVKKAYTEEALKHEGVIEDTLGGTPITIARSESGEITATNNETGEDIIPIRLFWFAWAAFNPDTELYR